MQVPTHFLDEETEARRREVARGFTLRVSGQHADPEVLWPEGPLRGAPAAILRAGRGGLLFLPHPPRGKFSQLELPFPTSSRHPPALPQGPHMRDLAVWPQGPPGSRPHSTLALALDTKTSPSSRRQLSGEACLSPSRPLLSPSLPLALALSLSLAASVSLSLFLPKSQIGELSN